MSVLAKLISADMTLSIDRLKKVMGEAFERMRDRTDANDFMTAIQLADAYTSTLIDVLPIVQFQTALRQVEGGDDDLPKALSAMVGQTLQLAQLCGTSAPTPLHAAQRYATMTAFANFTASAHKLISHASLLVSQGKSASEALKASKTKMDNETLTPEQLTTLANGGDVVLPNGRTLRMKPRQDNTSPGPVVPPMNGPTGPTPNGPPRAPVAGPEGKPEFFRGPVTGPTGIPPVEIPDED